MKEKTEETNNTKMWISFYKDSMGITHRSCNRIAPKKGKKIVYITKYI